MNLLSFQTVQFSIWSTTKSIKWFSCASVVGGLLDEFSLNLWIVAARVLSQGMNQWRRCRCQNVQWMNSFRHSHPPECGWGTGTHWGSIKEKKYSSYEQVRRIDDWSWSSDFGGGRHAADVVLIDIKTNKIIPFFKVDSLQFNVGVDWLYFISMHISVSIHCISGRCTGPSEIETFLSR